ncbi:GWxTD domain-containing protein [Balneolaceae bacterium ANBcel3]|nr:GWxTD domain-containing protein [Balneolaceae bacterium ANBcel3]
MYKTVLMAILFTIALGLHQPSASPYDSYPDFYEMGKEALSDRDSELALQIWHQGKLTYSEIGLSDPRIGFAYIQLAAEEKRQDNYQTATELYYWSLRSFDWERDRNIISEEVKRVIPLVSTETQSTWNRRLRQGDSTITRELLSFWIQQDPLLSTDINERLLLHWERIAYARKHYTLSKRSPYNTDDRGTIYVKYGTPNRVHTRNLSFNEVTEPFSSAPLSIPNTLYVRVEIWNYYLEGIYEPARFIFGSSGSGGTLRLQTSIMDMIPRGGHVLINNNYGRRGSQFLLLLASLEHLSFTDSYFANLYDDMVMSYISRFPISFDAAFSSIVPRITMAEQNYFLQQDYRIPSTSNRLMNHIAFNEIHVDYSFYRKLDENKNETIYYLSIGSDVEFQASYELLRSDAVNLEPELYLTHTLQTFDHDWNVVDRVLSQHPMEEVHGYYQSLFAFEGEKAGSHLVLNSELINKGRDTQPGPISDISDASKHLSAASSPHSLSLPEPLRLEEGHFTVSDIFIGREQEWQQDGQIPLIPAPSAVFHKEEEIMIYFEIYGLHHRTQNEPYVYEIEYVVLPKGEDKRASFTGREGGQTRIAFKSTSDSPDDHQMFGISFEKEPGMYEVHFTLRHHNQEKTQMFPLVIAGLEE